MPIERQTDEEIIAKVKQYYDNVVPGFDVQTEGTPEEEIFVKAPVFGMFTDLWNRLVDISYHQSFNDAAELSEEEFDKKMDNYSFPRRDAQVARGVLTLYVATLEVDINIPDGAVVSTVQGEKFTVNGAYTMYATAKDSYYNPADNAYILDVPIIALRGGVTGNVKASAIVSMETVLPGVVKIENKSATSGGVEKETNEQYLERFKEKLRGNQVTSYGGIIGTLDTEFVGIIDRALVLPGSRLMLRDEGLGGMVDAYILGETFQTMSDQFYYSGEDYVFKERPVTSVLSVAGSGLVTSTGTSIARTYSDAIFIQDTTSVTVGSVSSYDRLRFAENNKPFIGELVTVVYVMNRLIKDIQVYYNRTYNSAPNSDILIKAAPKIFLRITLRISVDKAYPFTEVADDVASALAAYVNALTLGVGITRLKVAEIVAEVDGVTNAALNSIEMEADIEGIIDENGDAVVNGIQYLRVDNDSQGRPYITVIDADA